MARNRKQINFYAFLWICNLETKAALLHACTHIQFDLTALFLGGFMLVFVWKSFKGIGLKLTFLRVCKIALVHKMILFQFFFLLTEMKFNQ